MLKKLLTAIVISTLLISCEKNSLIPEIDSEFQKIKTEKKEKKVKKFTKTLNVKAQDGGNSNTRVYDPDLVWYWEYGDALLGYQVAVDKIRNRLEYNLETGLFSCADFTYQSNKDERFHFVYPYDAEYKEGMLRPIQDGNWRPVCVFTTENIKINQLPTLTFEQLSSALELRIWNKDNNIVQDRVVSAVLTSEHDFVPVWVLDEETMTYSQILDGKIMEAKGLNSSFVQFNMPDLPKGYDKNIKIKLVLTRTDGKTMTTYLPSDLVFEKQSRTICNIIFEPDPSFTCATYNVDGLVLDASEYIHGLNKKIFKLMSSKLAEDNWDIIGFQEDFEYNSELTQNIRQYYNFGNFSGSMSYNPFFKPDGLLFGTNISTISSNPINIEYRIPFTDSYYESDNSVESYIDKGFRYNVVTFKDGLEIDVYLTQLTVGTTAGHKAARAANLTQLANYINNNRNGRPIIIMGDFAGLYTSDDFKTNFMNVLSLELKNNLRDPWADTQWDGYYPDYGEPAYVPSDLYDPIINAGDYSWCGEQNGEVPYKILYINDPQSDVRIFAKTYKRDMTYTDFSSRVPVVVDFGYEKVN